MGPGGRPGRSISDADCGRSARRGRRRSCARPARRPGRAVRRAALWVRAAPRRARPGRSPPVTSPRRPMRWRPSNGTASPTGGVSGAGSTPRRPRYASCAARSAAARVGPVDRSQRPPIAYADDGAWVDRGPPAPRRRRSASRRSRAAYRTLVRCRHAGGSTRPAAISPSCSPTGRAAEPVARRPARAARTTPRRRRRPDGSERRRCCSSSATAWACRSPTSCCATLIDEGWAPATARGASRRWPVGVAAAAHGHRGEPDLAARRPAGRRRPGRGTGRLRLPTRRCVPRRRPTRPPVLFHKARPRRSERRRRCPTRSRAVIADPDQRVVGVVVNAVDDHLARGDQVQRRLGPGVAASARLAARRRGRGGPGRRAHRRPRPRAAQRPAPSRRPLVGAAASAGGPCRPLRPSDEVEVAGPRVLLGGGRVVLPSRRPAPLRRTEARLPRRRHTARRCWCRSSVLARRSLTAGPTGRPRSRRGGRARRAHPTRLRSRRHRPRQAPTRRPQPTLFEPVAPPAPGPVACGRRRGLGRRAAGQRGLRRAPAAGPPARPSPTIGSAATSAPSTQTAARSRSAASGQRTGEPADTLRMALTLVQRLLNVDGAEVLDRARRRHGRAQPRRCSRSSSGSTTP